MRCAVFDHLGSAVDFDPAEPPDGFQPDFPHFCRVLDALRGHEEAEDLTVVLSWIDRPWRQEFGDRVVAVYIGRETPRVPTYLGEAWLAFSNMTTRPARTAVRQWPGSVPFALSLGARYGVNSLAYLRSRRFLGTPYLDIPIGRMNPTMPPWIEPANRRTDVNFIGSVVPGSRRRQGFGPKALGRRLAVRGAEMARAAHPELTFDMEVLTVFGARVEGYTERMADARVVLCPIGSHTETSRWEEAMSVGAVPLSFPNPVRPFFADHPGVELADWNDLGDTLAELFSDRDALHDRMRRCREFYEERLAPAAVAATIAAAIRSAGKQSIVK